MAKTVQDEIKIAALEEEVEALRAKVDQGYTVEFDGAKYQFVTAEFMLAGKTYTAETAAADPAVMQQLIELEAGFLRKI